MIPGCSKDRYRKNRCRENRCRESRSRENQSCMDRKDKRIGDSISDRRVCKANFALCTGSSWAVAGRSGFGANGGTGCTQRRQDGEIRKIHVGADGFARPTVLIGRVRSLSGRLSGPQSIAAGSGDWARRWIQRCRAESGATHYLPGQDDAGARTRARGFAGATLSRLHDSKKPSISFRTLNHLGHSNHGAQALYLCALSFASVTLKVS